MKKLGFFKSGDLFWTPTVPFHHFHQIFISTMSQIYKSLNRGQIWGFSWNLENRLYHLRFEVQKIFLYASLNVPRGGIPQGEKLTYSEKVYHKCVAVQV